MTSAQLQERIRQMRADYERIGQEPVDSGGTSYAAYCNLGQHIQDAERNLMRMLLEESGIPTEHARYAREVEEQVSRDIAQLANTYNGPYGEYCRQRDAMRADAAQRIAAYNQEPSTFNWTRYDVPIPSSNQMAALLAERLNVPSFDALVGAEMPSAPDAPVPEAETDDDSETETDTYTCAACGNEHSTDVEHETVLAENGDFESASTACLDDSDMFVSLDVQTRSERAEHVTRAHVYQTVTATCDTTASLAHAENSWYHSENDDCWYQSYEDSSEYQAEEAASNSMYDYDKDVIDTHGWPDATPPESLCFGVELECEASDDLSELCEALGGKDGNGTYILKSDGSLENGTELVTLPFTLEYHQARFNWASVLRSAMPIANSGAGTNTCGIHVHINRAAISALTLGKMLVFVNDPRNVKAIQGIAQRSECSWAKFHAKKLTDGKNGKDLGARYQALNVTPHTVEVRIFKGNLRSERILKNIEFCHALVSYCRTASMQHLTWELFWNWMRGTPSNRKLYGNLIDFAHDLLRHGSSQTEKDI